MGWSSNWDDEKSQIVDTGKPYSEVLREHNQAAEAQMKAAIITKTGQEILANALPHVEFAIGIDWGKEDKTVCVIKQGDAIVCTSENVELIIPMGWNTFKANALQIGDLAVILSTDDPEEHCMVHVPTQTWFDNAIPTPPEPFDGYSTEALCLWAWKVQQDKYPGNVGFPLWEMIGTYSNKTYKNIPDNVLNILMKYCLSIKVE